jgi:uncharacterized protein YjbI with pentapeptide repeats
MRAWSFLAVLAVSGALFAACGSAPASAYKASANCTVSSSNTNYNGCDLAHRNLSGVDLQNDSFVRADLNGVNLSGANIQGAVFTGATYKGVVTTTSTVCVNAQFGPCDGPGLRGRKKVHYS